MTTVAKRAGTPRVRRRRAVTAAKSAPVDAHLDVGARLNYLRKLYGLSLRELARRAGMTHSTVSLIERNEISPSVGSLRRMCDSFPMTLAEFFALDIEDQGKVFFSPKELAEVGIGGVSLLQVGHNLKGRPLQVLLERYPPGSETAFTPYAHQGEEGGVVIEGEIEATIGDQVRVLKRFEGFLFPSRLPHRFRNSGKVDCVIVSACTPPV